MPFLVFIFIGGGCGHQHYRRLIHEMREVTENRKMSLAEKAAFYQREIRAKHLSREGLLITIAEVNPNSAYPAYLNESDGSYWTACYLASQALRFQSTGEDDALTQILQSVHALKIAHDVTGVSGLFARCYAPKEEFLRWKNPSGIWLDGAAPLQDYMFRSDVSGSNVNGIVFGLACAFDALEPLREMDAAQKALEDIREVLSNVGDHLIKHNLYFHDRDGKPTKWGAINPNFFPTLIPYHCLMCLSIFKSIAHVAGYPYDEYYAKLVAQKYPEAAVGAKFKLFDMSNNSSDNTLALMYYKLLEYEKDPRLQNLYQKSLHRSWKIARYSLVATTEAVVAGRAKGLHDASRAQRDLLLVLGVFPENQIPPALSVQIRQNKIVRPDLRPKDSFLWKKYPEIMEMTNGEDGRKQFSGVDFLLPYWMARKERLIP